MAKRHKLWARVTRARMILALGGKCVACETQDNLTFDCIVPMGHAHHHRSAPERITFYTKQMRAGNVQLLCSRCNAIKADTEFDAWIEALQYLRTEVRLLRPQVYPGQGTGGAADTRQSILRDFLYG